MDSLEPERSSSSPSVKIDRLVRRKSRRPGEEIKVTLSDASSFFVSMRVWEDAPFHEGDELPTARWEEILARTDLIRARGQALCLLARSEHSRFLLRRKLLQRGYHLAAIDASLDALEADGSLSDERFAASWVRGRMRSHPEGRAHLIAGLRARGIDAAPAERAVDDAIAESGDSIEQLAREYAERLTRRRTLSPDALADRLRRRGFAGSVVRAVVTELGWDRPEDDGGDVRP
ncbi:MAG: regulatory protein RecX [Spirochaetota bacterium]